MTDRRGNYRSGLICTSGDSSMGQVVEESSKRRKTNIGGPCGSKKNTSGKTVLEKEK